MKKINKKQKNKWVPRICIISTIVIILVCVFTYFLVRDLKQEDVLREEVINLSKKDFTKDRYNTSVKTRGDYAVVEEAIKNYFDSYANNLQSLSKVSADKKLASLLSAENYKNDGPDFIKTKKYINETKTSFNTKLAELTNMTSEEEIMKQIDDKKLDKYYVDLYRELMLSETAENDFKISQDNLKKLGESINNILNTEEAVIDLLIAEKGKWVIADDKIVFQDTNVLNKYNELIKNYQNKQ